MSELAKWYVVHTYSGYENSVAANILKAAENRRMQDLIQEVNIPMETVKEITDSGEKTVERKVFPGYVLVKMVLTDESWHLVHNVRGAAGFVGSDGKAIPLTEQEIYDLGVEHHEVVVGYELGDSVKITDGPLSSFLGTVQIKGQDSIFILVAIMQRHDIWVFLCKHSQMKDPCLIYNLHYLIYIRNLTITSSHKHTPLF